MNRVWDYIGFVIWFMGLGYIVMWLIGSPEYRMLPPIMHMIGLASATFVAVRLLLLAIARWRVPWSVARAMSDARPPEAVLKPPPAKPVRPLPTVKPRNQFGLRGARQKNMA
jgi:hypothetical protein